MALKHKNDIAERFSRAAHRYDAIASIQVKLATKALARKPASSGVVLDIGCATGQHTIGLGCKTIGLDLALGMLQNAKQTYGKRATWLNADMDALPFQQHSFDQVFSSMALQWSDSATGVIEEIHRVLKPKGSATLLIPVEGSFQQLYTAYKRIGVAAKLNRQRHEADWIKATEHSGFNTVSAEVIVETDKHGTLMGLLSSISKIGAASNQHQQHAPLTRKTLQALDQAYEKRSDGQLPLDYRCLLITVEK